MPFGYRIKKNSTARKQGFQAGKGNRELRQTF